MDNILEPKSYSFALKVIRLYKWLCKEKKEYVLSNQLLRSDTAIGALIREAKHAQSKADFLHKMNISLKEANETEYWLMLLNDSKYLSPSIYDTMHKDCDELIRILASIVKTTKLRLN